MHAAGMTHGGFYKHFDSRDDLVAAAVEEAFRGANATMTELIESSQDPLAEFVYWYLSAEHVADPGHGCAVAALGGEILRADQRVRSAYRAQIERYLDALETLVGTRERANVTLSTLIRRDHSRPSARLARADRRSPARRARRAQDNRLTRNPSRRARCRFSHDGRPSGPDHRPRADTQSEKPTDGSSLYRPRAWSPLLGAAAR